MNVFAVVKKFLARTNVSLSTLIWGEIPKIRDFSVVTVEKLLGKCRNPGLVHLVFLDSRERISCLRSGITPDGSRTLRFSSFSDVSLCLQVPARNLGDARRSRTFLLLYEMCGGVGVAGYLVRSRHFPFSILG